MGNRAGQDSFLTMEQWHWLTDIPIDELEEQYNTHIQVYDGATWFKYMSMELKHEALTLMVTTVGDYFTHEVLSISDVKGFRAHSDDTREKLKPVLKELKELI